MKARPVIILLLLALEQVRVVEGRPIRVTVAHLLCDLLCGNRCHHQVSPLTIVKP